MTTCTVDVYIHGHLEVAALVRRVGRAEDGNVPHVHVCVIGNSHCKSFHGFLVQSLQLHSEGADRRGVSRCHGCARARPPLPSSLRSMSGR